MLVPVVLAFPLFNTFFEEAIEGYLTFCFTIGLFCLTLGALRDFLEVSLIQDLGPVVRFI